MKQRPPIVSRVLVTLCMMAFPVPAGISAELGKATILFTDKGTDLNPHLLTEIRALAGYLKKNPQAQIQIGRTVEGGATEVRALKIFRAFADLGIDPARISFVPKAGPADGKVGLTIVDVQTVVETTRVVPTAAQDTTEEAGLSLRYDAKGEPQLENDPGVKSFLLSAGQPGHDALVIAAPKLSAANDEESKIRAEVRALGLYEILVRSGVPAARLVVAEPKPAQAAGASTLLWTKDDAVAARVQAEDAQALRNANVKPGLNLAAGMTKYRESQVVQAADAAGRNAASGKEMSLAARSGAAVVVEEGAGDAAAAAGANQQQPTTMNGETNRPVVPTNETQTATPNSPSNTEIANPKKTTVTRKKVVVKKVGPLTPDWTGVFSLGLAAPREGLASETDSGLVFGLGMERNLARPKKDATIRAGLMLWHTSLSPKNSKLSGDLSLTAVNLRGDYVFHLPVVKPYAGLTLGLYKWDGAIKQKVTGLVHDKDTFDSGIDLHAGVDWALSPQFTLAPELAFHKIGGAFSDSFFIFQMQVRWKF